MPHAADADGATGCPLACVFARASGRARRPTTSMRLVHSSTDPLLFLIEDFITPNQCACLKHMSERVEQSSGGCAGPALAVHDEQFTQAEQTLLADIEERIGIVTGCPPHSEELPLLLLHKSPEAARPAKPSAVAVADPAATASAGTLAAADIQQRAQTRYPAGIHLDTHAFPVRFASALLYISSPSSGGQTVFPLAAPRSEQAQHSNGNGDQLRAASDKMIAHDVHHTRFSDDPALSAATLALEAAALNAPSVFDATDGSGIDATRVAVPAYATHEDALSVAPKAGNLVVFWTREADATIAARSWHGGEAVYHDSAEDKWLLRKFKEIPANVFHNQASRIAFMAQSHAEAHQRLPRAGAQGLRVP